MNIPSIAQAGNILASSIGNGVLGYWSIVDTEKQTLIAQFDTFYNFSFTQTNAVTTYPLENGEFMSYNKQNSPATINVTLIKSGLTISYMKKKFIDSLNDYINTSKLVDIITPQGSYLNYSLSGLNYANDAEDNSDMVIANLTATEIRFIGGQIKSANNNVSTRVKQGLKSAVAL